MRIAEYKQTGTRTEDRVRTVPAVYDDDGNITQEAYDETYTAEVPVMGLIYRDMTDDEISAMETVPEPELSADERIEELENAILELAELIGG